MEYHIRVKGASGQYQRIASFENEQDRDICFDALEDYREDAEFSVEEG